MVQLSKNNGHEVHRNSTTLPKYPLIGYFINVFHIMDRFLFDASFRGKM